MANHYDFPDPNYVAPTVPSGDLLTDVIGMVFSQAGVAGLFAFGLGYMLFKLVSSQSLRQDRAQEKLSSQNGEIMSILALLRADVAKIDGRVEGLEREMTMIGHRMT